jgi:hypothetical protein
MFMVAKIGKKREPVRKTEIFVAFTAQNDKKAIYLPQNI